MKLLGALRRLLFPPLCVFCRGIMEPSEYRVCPACQASLPWLAGGQMESRVEGSQLCLSALRYRGAARDSLLRFKFSGRKWYCRTFGEILARTVEQNLQEPFDLLTWVPVSGKRRRKRGYDQSFLLARELGRRLGMEPVPLLYKCRHNPVQSRQKGAGQRRANVLGAYRAEGPEVLRGKRVLLVDDVVTTGATLSECACTLRLAGAEQVVCLTLTRA